MKMIEVNLGDKSEESLCYILICRFMQKESQRGQGCYIHHEINDQVICGQILGRTFILLFKHVNLVNKN